MHATVQGCYSSSDMEDLVENEEDLQKETAAMNLPVQGMAL